MLLASQQIPREFYCPLSNEVMKDPVLTMDGFCFERSAILQWFGKGNKNNPITFIQLESLQLISNNPLRSIISRFSQYTDKIDELRSKCDGLQRRVQMLQSENKLLRSEREANTQDQFRYQFDIKDGKTVQKNIVTIAQKYYDTAASAIFCLPAKRTIKYACISIESKTATMQPYTQQYTQGVNVTHYIVYLTHLTQPQKYNNKGYIFSQSSRNTQSQTQFVTPNKYSECTKQAYAQCNVLVDVVSVKPASMKDCNKLHEFRWQIMPLFQSRFAQSISELKGLVSLNLSIKDGLYNDAHFEQLANTINALPELRNLVIVCAKDTKTDDANNWTSKLNIKPTIRRQR